MTAAKKTQKKPKQENPLVLNAEVIGGSILHRRLGRIVKVSKSLLTVEWASGTKTLYGRRGQGFHGRVDEHGEAITTRHGQPIEDVWDNEDTLDIATESTKARINEEIAKKEKQKQERAAQQAAIEAAPAYIARSTSLKNYAELLRPVSGNVENSWNKDVNYRIELENISPDRMDDLIRAIVEALTEK